MSTKEELRAELGAASVELKQMADERDEWRSKYLEMVELERDMRAHVHPALMNFDLRRPLKEWDEAIRLWDERQKQEREQLAREVAPDTSGLRCNESDSNQDVFPGMPPAGWR